MKDMGTISPHRGAKYRDLAKEFIKKHPVGSTMSTEDFDRWLHDSELLTLPPEDVPKSSDAWLGHLQRRHICRGRLNKGATHPRMAEDGSEPFIIIAIRNGFEVRAPHLAVARGKLAEKIKTLTETKRRQLSYLMQSADWSVLPPHERGQAELIADDIDALAEDTATGADRIGRKLAKLEAKIRLAIERGEIKPQNHGLTQLLAPPDADDVE